MTQASHIRVPYAQSVHGQAEIDAVVRVLQTSTSLGKETLAFERSIADRFGKKHGIMVNSGSSANLLAMELIGGSPGDEVITPLLTFATVVAPIIQKGYVPVFVDVDPQTFVIRPEDVEAAIGPKTKALLIPSLLGNLPNLEALADIAARHNLIFIEDSCDTIGGSWNGQPTGTFSHITTTSFYGSHIINGAGGGGMIMVNDDKWAERLLVLRGWGRQSSLFGEGRESEKPENRFNVMLGDMPYDRKFLFSEIGYNFLPLEMSAAFGRVQLERLDEFADLRRAHFTELREHLLQWPNFILPSQLPEADSVWLAMPFIVRDTAPFTRLELATYLEKADIQTRPIFTGNALKHPAFKDIDCRLAVPDFPGTDQVMRGGLVLAVHQGLTSEQMQYVKDTLSAFMSTVFAQNNWE
jgi:CDP-6-deoxy-D-xylo-4-hexulose-3-dehydrase